MSLVVVNQAEADFLTLITDVDMTLRLYQNDVTNGLTQAQIEALTAANFTEANFAGYSASSMTTSWTVTQGDPTVASRAAVTFTRSSTGTAQLIYGYYITRNSDGALRAFEDFDGPVSVEFINDALVVTPTITLGDAEDNVEAVGSGKIWFSDTPPTNWLLCQGQAISRTTYAELFGVMGTTYGVGDGSTTFNLPNLRQRFPMGKAASGTGATLGGTGGNVDHTHGLDTASSHAKIANSVVAGADPVSRRKTVTSWTSTHDGSGTGGAAVGAVTVGTELGGTSDTGNPPFQVVNYIVKAL